MNQLKLSLTVSKIIIIWQYKESSCCCCWPQTATPCLRGISSFDICRLKMTILPTFILSSCFKDWINGRIEWKFHLNNYLMPQAKLRYCMSNNYCSCSC